MMKNKENININNWNNRMINNYSNKNNNILCAKIRNKCNFIEPKNLFHNLLNILVSCNFCSYLINF